MPGDDPTHAALTNGLLPHRCRATPARFRCCACDDPLLLIETESLVEADVTLQRGVTTGQKVSPAGASQAMS